MRRPKEDPSSRPSERSPFGIWSEAELKALPRFPHHDSFQIAKGLINRFLLQEEGLAYRDLRIALFWLGFGLLDVPTPAEPTMHLVPLCKDLDSYTETATELGYDPSSSVHSRPICRSHTRAQARSAMPPWHHSVSSSSGYSSQRTERGPSSSSSSATAVAHSSGPPPKSPPPLQAVGRHKPPQNGYQGSAQISIRHSPCCSVPDTWRCEENDTPPEEEGSKCLRKVGRPHWLRSNDPPSDEEAAEGSSDSNSSPEVGSRGASTTGRAWAWRDFAYGGFTLEPEQALACKVKLLHAGGWSTSSSGSEGGRTPPTPTAASSTATAAQAKGLNSDHIEQFTVSFVSDLSLHEDLEETCCLCTFCLDEMRIGDELCRLPCMHTFHRHCVHAWLARDRRCMLCRLDVTHPCG